MNKEELFKELKKLHDYHAYDGLMNQGYQTAILDAIDLIKKYFNTENFKSDKVVIPEWLTSEVQIKAKETYCSHKDPNDSKRVEAIRIIQKAASDSGYKIDLKKAIEILQTILYK